MNADSEQEHPSSLRRRAEGMLKARTGAGEEKLSAAEARRLVHELRVHELELEMQNEELRRAHDELEESRSKYSDLYDFAPVGYLTLDPKGRILEANLTACAQLGVERSFLIEKPLYVHVAADEGSRFFRHLKTVFEDETRQNIELKLKTAKGDEFRPLSTSPRAERRRSGSGKARRSTMHSSRKCSMASPITASSSTRTAGQRTSCSLK
jgi:PAS domain S-box-containing protein